MGLFGNLFGGKIDTSDADRALADEKRASAKERATTDALKAKQQQERNALKLRQKNMQGGGRSGLMFGGNQQGVE